MVLYKPNKKRGSPKLRRKVFVGMSGGVDSSVAAYLLKKQGYDVVGVFMRSYNIDDCAERDAEDARRVAEKIRIPFYVFDFEEEYKKRVVEYMIDGYRKGITPNPDVMCNKEIKFGLFLKKAIEMGADYVATGHYVLRRPVSRHRLSIRSSDESQPTLSASRLAIRETKLAMPARVVAKQDVSAFELYEAKDKNKDQSYFLWTLTQDQLKHCLFPIGDYLKLEVREIARKAGLPTAEKKDSQGICFLGEINLEDFLKQYIKPKKGDILDKAGHKIGKHEGVYYYTIGQRHLGLRSLDLGVRGNRETKPYYVAEKNIKNNTLVVAEGDSNLALYKKEVELTNVNFVSLSANYKLPITVFARVRYRQPLAKAVLSCESSVVGCRLIFDQAQKFVAPGQSAVFYGKNGVMLGGGVIY